MELVAGGSKNFNVVKQELAKLGLTIKQTGTTGGDGPEYVVKFKDDKNPDHGYFTHDLDDALGTGKHMAEWRRENGTTASDTKIYDPLFSEPAKEYTTTASGARAITPTSPISNQPMQLISVGSYGQVPFKAWVHLSDRIVLPARGES